MKKTIHTVSVKAGPTALTMKSLWTLALVAVLGDAFAPSSKPRYNSLLWSSTEEQEALQFEKFQEIGSKLRTSIHGNGFDSKDPKYGVESIYATIPIRPGEGLGLELTEVAHSTTKQNQGLVLISNVGGNAAKYTSARAGDTIVGVSCQSADFKMSTAGMDYEYTMDAIIQAKTQAELLEGSSISLQLNRLVRRAPITVIVEDGDRKPAVLECLAGDNLRLVLKRHGLLFTANDCGGEGICGTDMVEIVEGEDCIDYLSSSTSRLKKACQTIVGSSNEASTVRIRIAANTKPNEE
jgi:ferredoxin